MDISIASPIALRSAAEAWIRKFNDALQRRDYDAAAAMFAPNAYWRDLLAFTWTLRTFKGPEEVRNGLMETQEICEASDFKLEGQEPTVGELGQFGRTLEVFFNFRTRTATGRGFLRLIPDESGSEDLKAFTYLTTIKEL